MALKEYSEMDYHPLSEDLVTILTQKTQNTSKHFFRILVAYYLSKVATTMRCKVKYMTQGDIPVNLYALNLAESGFGKGMSTGLIEDQVINQFYREFTTSTYPAIAEKAIDALAFKRANTNGTDHATEIDNVRSDFERCGSLLFSFDSGTGPALKQLRQKLLMSDCGSLNYEMDEVGTNLLNNTELLATFLELYDVGKIKQKLIKNTQDNKRDAEILGRTPANMMLFGTPSRLLNGGKEEAELYSMFETGFGRRFWYGFSRKDNQGPKLTPKQRYDLAMSPGAQNADAKLEKISNQLGLLANVVNHDMTIEMPESVTLLLMEYDDLCKAKAEKMPAHATIRKAEFEHRYFRILKLAAVYAFIDGSPDIQESHLYAAMKLAIDSADAFDKIMNREKPHVKLAKYICDVGEEVTQSDLMEDLPFYRGTIAAKNEMMTLATAWGYKNNRIIKKSYVDSIEFFRGESLKETDLNQMIFSWSQHVAYNYMNEKTHWDNLPQLLHMEAFLNEEGNLPDGAEAHWVNHHFKAGDKGEGHRADDNVLAGFNMVVLDIDGGATVEAVRNVLKDHKYLIYTTKRHGQEGVDRFRVVLPTNYELSLNNKDFREFMEGVKEWFPFEMDDGTFQCSKKWLSHYGDIYVNDGDLFDVLPFIPRTAKDEERKKISASQSSMNNLERWVINNTGDGNRNNNIMRYGFILYDMGHDFVTIRSKIMELNGKMQDSLPESEIDSTIMKTIARKVSTP